MFRSKKPKPSPKVLWHGSNIKQQHHLNPAALITSKNSNLLDKGQFGQIFTGQYLRRNIAIKTINLKQDDEKDFKSAIRMFVDECEISLQIGRHKHILFYIGVIFPEKMPEFNKTNLSLLELPILISEFMPNGNMKKYLDDSKLKNFTVYKALEYCIQLANGMRFLHTQKINHADLACRNLLLDSELTLKISDFGLSQKGVEYNYGFAIDDNQQYLDYDRREYQTTNLDDSPQEQIHNNRFFPIWWAAIEVHHNQKITNFSDVWSFGVTAWEIFTRGLTPNANIKQLNNNFRLNRPRHCPLAVFMLLLRCWHKDPKERPTAVSSRGTNISVTLDIFGSNFCYAKVKNFVTLRPKFLLRTKF